MKVQLMMLFCVFVMSHSKDTKVHKHEHNTTRVTRTDVNIIVCHTSDFTCFKKQFRWLRDSLLMGSVELNIKPYAPYLVSYGDTGTCVRFTGVEDSELVAISMDSRIKEFSITLELPVRVQQVKHDEGLACINPDNDFTDVPPHDGALMKFAGNATATVSYPYELQKKRGQVYMMMGEETVEVTLDMPDLSQHDRESELEAKLYAWSEWAYQMVQHVDIAQHVLMPFTGQMRRVTATQPLSRLLLLYPDEEYSSLKFSFLDPSIELERKR